MYSQTSGTHDSDSKRHGSSAHLFRGKPCSSEDCHTSQRPPSSWWKYLRVQARRTYVNLISPVPIDLTVAVLAIWRDGPNNATPFPPPSKVEGSYHWSYERLLAAALIPLTGSAVVVSGSAYPIIDGILGVSLIIH